LGSAAGAVAEVFFDTCPNWSSRLLWTFRHT
jgi:hypothetical protein